MTEFEAFKNMLVSMMRYMNIAEEPKDGKKFYDDELVEEFEELLNAVPEILRNPITKAFADTFKEDYAKLLEIVVKAILSSLSDIEKLQGDIK